jgi:hypothetical protein
VRFSGTGKIITKIAREVQFRLASYEVMVIREIVWNKPPLIWYNTMEKNTGGKKKNEKFTYLKILDTTFIRSSSDSPGGVRVRRRK